MARDSTDIQAVRSRLQQFSQDYHEGGGRPIPDVADVIAGTNEPMVRLAVTSRIRRKDVAPLIVLMHSSIKRMKPPASKDEKKALADGDRINWWAHNDAGQIGLLYVIFRPAVGGLRVRQLVDAFTGVMGKFRKSLDSGAGGGDE